MLTTVTELPEYIWRANELLNEAERKSIIEIILRLIHGQGTSWKALVASVKFFGREEAEEKVAVSASFTITMTNAFRFICLLFLEKMKNRISQNLNVTNLLSLSAYLCKLR